MRANGYTLTLVIITAVLAYGRPSKPIAYTSGYANVSYQPKTGDNSDTDYTEKALENAQNNNVTDIRTDSNSKKVPSNKEDEITTGNKNKLSSWMEKEREEVTERSHSKFSNDSIDITTERDSEQINLARLKNLNINKNDKLQKHNDSTREKENNDDIDSVRNNDTQILEPADELADLNMDNDADFVKKKNGNDKLQAGDDFESREISNDKLKSDVVFESTIDELEALEATDLNNEGVYYIYHPNGLLQKVVYASKISAEDNMSPIVEPILTYDPNTFVLQRLQILSTT